MQTAKTVNLTVTLDKTAKIPVVISNRKQTAASGDTIKWMKKGAGEEFDITGFAPIGVGEAFQNKDAGGNGQWLSVDFSPAAASKNYPYTLTVTSGGKEFTSDEIVNAPDDRKAVIRNGP